MPLLLGDVARQHSFHHAIRNSECAESSGAPVERKLCRRTPQDAGGEAMSDPLKPTPALLAKLGSIAVHADELLSDDGHVFDRHALKTLLAQDDVQEWLADM